MYDTSDIEDSWYSGSIKRIVLETEFSICGNCCVRNIQRKSKNSCSVAVVNIPLYIICSVVDDNVVDVKNTSKVHPPSCYFFVLR